MKRKIILLIILSVFFNLGCKDKNDLTPDPNLKNNSSLSKDKASNGEKKYTPVSQELYNEISTMDEAMTVAFNSQNFEKFKSMFSKDLEWFQDNNGLVPYKKCFENFKKTFIQDNKLTRKLMPGSLEVYPVKNYGAIEIGIHQFAHMEDGKQEIGTFKFIHIWRKRAGNWKISKVISYDH